MPDFEEFSPTPDAVAYGRLFDVFSDHIDVEGARLDTEAVAPHAYAVYEGLKQEFGIDDDRLAVIGGLAAREAWIMKVEVDSMEPEDFLL